MMTQGNARRTAILILGMHRSGTSAFTRVLNYLGATLPSNLLSPNRSNEAGHWEPVRLVELHDNMLQEAGSSWDDWRPFDMATLPEDRAQYYRETITRILVEEYGDAPLIVLKDPRLCRFVPLYTGILEEMQFDVRYVHVLRNLLAVTASLSKRDGLTSGYGALLWLRYELESERATRGRPRVFVSYEAMIADWRAQVLRITNTLCINWPRSIDECLVEIDSFISLDRQHNAASDEAMFADERVPTWTKEIYSSLKRLENDANDSNAIATHDCVTKAFNTATAILGDPLSIELDTRHKSLARLTRERNGLSERLAAIEATAVWRSATLAHSIRSSLAAEVRRALRGMTEAFSRMAKPRARNSRTEPFNARWANRGAPLWRWRHHDMTFAPIDQIDGSTTAAQLSLATNRRRLPVGWCRISIDVPQGAPPLPRLVLLAFEGADKVVSVVLPSKRSGEVNGLVHLPMRVDRLRLQPSEGSGEFQIARVGITEFGKLQLFAKLLLANPSGLIHLLNSRSLTAFKTALVQEITKRADLTEWYSAYRRGFDYQSIVWRGSAKISVVMPVYKIKPQWLDVAIQSVLKQTYPYWELIVIDDGSNDSALSKLIDDFTAKDTRIKAVALSRNFGISRAANEGIKIASGEYILFMDHDDLIEPHALARLADAAFSENSDVVFADEVVTGEEIDDIRSIRARPKFSYTYYLSYAYIVHPIMVRTTLARAVGGLASSLTISQDIDFVLRVLEYAKAVTHVPDVLYRWRTLSASAGHKRMTAVMKTTARLKTEHLRRLGFLGASVNKGASFNTFSVRYFSQPKGRILVVIPTKDQVALLRRCIDSVRKTTSGLNIDIVVVDHQSNNLETKDYLRSLHRAGAAQIVPYDGPFNYSAINNKAIAAYGHAHDYFLFLNNDIEAKRTGWLEAMLDLAMRSDVGAVGANLLYPDGTVQHSGVIIGIRGLAEHAHKTVPLRANDAGYNGSLHATREYSAVTAACMLVPAKVFREAGGFDELLAVGFNDTDLCLRIQDHGYVIVNCADAVLLHHEFGLPRQELRRD